MVVDKESNIFGSPSGNPGRLGRSTPNCQMQFPGKVLSLWKISAKCVQQFRRRYIPNRQTDRQTQRQTADVICSITMRR